jgi:hypothetical protein
MDTFHSLHNGQQLEDAGKKITCPRTPLTAAAGTGLYSCTLPDSCILQQAPTYTWLPGWTLELRPPDLQKFPSSYLLDSPTNDIIMTCLLPSMSATAL